MRVQGQGERETERARVRHRHRDRDMDIKRERERETGVKGRKRGNEVREVRVQLRGRERGQADWGRREGGRKGARE